jgi:transcriptional regulator with XRE-family HTH domain
LRKRLNWTQDQLATTAKVSKSFISEVESGASQPRGPVLVKIAAALRASIDYLMTGREPAAQAAKPVEIPSELASFAKRRGVPYPHVELLLDFHNSVVGMRRDQPDVRPTEKEWEELYDKVLPYIEKALNSGKE